MNHSRRNNMSCFLAKSGSIFENGIMWKARSHAAKHGYSHLSGMEMTSRLKRWVHSRFRPNCRSAGGGGWAASPDNHSRIRSEEHTSELQSQFHLVCRLLLEKKKKKKIT